MLTLEAFLQAMIADPHSAVDTWPVLADWLEEQDDPRSELVRLLYHREYQQAFSPQQRDNRVRELLESGVQLIAPIVENSIGMQFALIPPGVFLMGSPESEAHRNEDETQHEVEITEPFFLGVYPVTQEEYQSVMVDNRGGQPDESARSAEYHRVLMDHPEWFEGSTVEASLAPPEDWEDPEKSLDAWRFPVVGVSWKDAVAFCRKLSALEEETRSGRVYRLPSEAEWEYACRGGAACSSAFHFGDYLSSKASCTAKNRTCPVGIYRPNAFSLYDMHGKVLEWCHDWYEKDYYKHSPKRDPQGPDSGTARVLRGGSWNGNPWAARSAIRFSFAPSGRDRNRGFRVAFGLA